MKKFEKSIIIAPKRYSLTLSFYDTLKRISDEVKIIDVKSLISQKYFSINTQIFRLPSRLRLKWEKFFTSKINNEILEILDKESPNLIFVYNSQFLLPETCQEIKSRGIRLLFFLGDSPFYTFTNESYLHLLQYADVVLSPDSYWIKQLNQLGYDNVFYFISGIEKGSYYEADIKILENLEIDKNELLYVGLNYTHSWGYKKALFLNSFKNDGLKIYGNRHWRKWFNYFPELEDIFILSGYIPVERLNLMLNNTKIVPIDGNPGILNGFHVRVLEALGAGALPLAEYRYDINNKLLKKCNAKLPQIINYKKASSIANYYLKNDSERKELVKEIKNFILNEYSYKNNSELLLEYLKK